MQDIKNKIEDLKSVAEKLAIEIQVTNLNDQDFTYNNLKDILNDKFSD